ncbi:MAG: riboflavin synthase [Actinobacteria bacterium]|uniref:Riboflavin synthase n=1 Tax=freshwater metagenome TaxID=449393 RepID=A0A6J6HWX0_9ZZZZ|nr:riboflavin synthase [Actinomycetota bacterium]MSZ46091.1 riboflavin synthase [Actinomycetota bacterium]MTA22062.1 riboflavin synthase [Actinomycetota bacterium]
MFTGLVSELGEVIALVQSADSAVITIKSPETVRDLAIGGSVSVNGTCLTAVEIGEDYFVADVMIQTLNLTSLSSLIVGSFVNLELAATLNMRMGGHIVQGHVDGVGTVREISPEVKWTKFVIEIPAPLSKYIVNQGSIALDGVSLTVGTIDDQNNFVTVWLIPETLAKTNLSRLHVGTPINIEVDVLAKYVERLMEKKSTHE